MPVQLPRFDHPWVREERAPIYVLDYPPTATTAAIHEYYDAMARFYQALSSPIACVALVSNIESLSAPDGLAVARRERELAPFQRQYLRGTAMVVDSALRRSFLAAIFWATPPCYRWKTFVDYERACFWAHSQLYSVRPPNQNVDP